MYITTNVQTMQAGSQDSAPGVQPPLVDIIQQVPETPWPDVFERMKWADDMTAEHLSKGLKKGESAFPAAAVLHAVCFRAGG